MAIPLSMSAPVSIRILGQGIKLFVPVLPMLTAPSRNEVTSVLVNEKTAPVGFSLLNAALAGPQWAWVVCLCGHFSQTSLLAGTLHSEFLWPAPHFEHLICLQSRMKCSPPQRKHSTPVTAWISLVGCVWILVEYWTTMSLKVLYRNGTYITCDHCWQLLIGDSLHYRVYD